MQHLAQVEEKTILGTEYRRAQEHFHHVSRLKKAVDSRIYSRAETLTTTMDRLRNRVEQARETLALAGIKPVSA